MLFETGEAQVALARELVARNGLLPSTVTDDDLGATVVIGQAR